MDDETKTLIVINRVLKSFMFGICPVETIEVVVIFYAGSRYSPPARPYLHVLTLTSICCNSCERTAAAC